MMIKGNTTDLSIIVVCYKGWGRLRKCLDSLKGFKGDLFVSEVIVVNNNPGDRTIDEFEKEYQEFRFVQNKVNGGYANGNNLGAEYATGEFLLILNPDTVASEEVIWKLLDIAKKNTSYKVLSCRQPNEKGKETTVVGDFPNPWNLTGLQRSIANIISGRKKIKTDSENPDILFPDWISGSVVLMKRDLYTRIGGFYEGFWMYYEDVDLCRRVTGIGGIIAYIGDLDIEHNHGGSSRINTATASITKTEVHISRHLYVSRNMRGLTRVLTQLFLVINNLLTSAVMALPGLVFFFVPKIHVRTLIFLRLVSYYFKACVSRSWISKRSVLAQK